jgi:hypothetical protein
MTETAPAGFIGLPQAADLSHAVAAEAHEHAARAHRLAARNHAAGNHAAAAECAAEALRQSRSAVGLSQNADLSTRSQGMPKPAALNVASAGRR